MMKPTISVQNLQRTRKQMCLMSNGEQSAPAEMKKSKFDEMIERLGNEIMFEEENTHRKTKSEICIINGIQKPHSLGQTPEEEFFVTEIIADAKPLFINKNDTKSEEFTL